MDRTTKYCELNIQLCSGARVKGKFHVPLRTGSTIRPSDALRECKDGFLILCDASIAVGETVRSHAALLVPINSVDYVELPGGNWAINSPA